MPFTTLLQFAPFPAPQCEKIVSSASRFSSFSPVEDRGTTGQCFVSVSMRHGRVFLIGLNGILAALPNTAEGRRLAIASSSAKDGRASFELLTRQQAACRTGPFRVKRDGHRALRTFLPRTSSRSSAARQRRYKQDPLGATHVCRLSDTSPAWLLGRQLAGKLLAKLCQFTYRLRARSFPCHFNLSSPRAGGIKPPNSGGFFQNADAGFWVWH